MTYVGHSLTGVALGVLCEPRSRSARRLLVHYAVFALIANLPDLPVSGWGHDRYDVSHSMFVALALFALAAVLMLMWKGALERIGGWGTFGLGCIAWLSHLLLDSFYNHGQGIAIFWPLSEGRLALPIPWFSVVNPLAISAGVVREYAVELASFLPLLVAAILVKRASEARRLARLG
jgi:hypothetical protein